MKPLSPVWLFSITIFLQSCASSSAQHTANVCQIFEDNRSWFRAAKESEERWGVPIAVNMAIINQESGFRARAKPARGKFLWVFPGSRPSSAYGYAQALDSTWEEYEQQTGNNGSRRKFADAIDFVGWYNDTSNRQSRISKSDGKSLYLAYHEGNGGFQKRSYEGKDWLLDAAERVQENSVRFERQLNSCRSELEKNWFQRILF